MTTEQTPGGLDMMGSGQAEGNVLYNENLYWLERGFRYINMKSFGDTAPPGSPADGDTYLVGASATGDWAGQDGNIAQYYGGWKFIAPKTGATFWVEDVKIWIMYVVDAWAWVGGSWPPLDEEWFTGRWSTTGEKIYTMTIDDPGTPPITISSSSTLSIDLGFATDITDWHFAQAMLYDQSADPDYIYYLGTPYQTSTIGYRFRQADAGGSNTFLDIRNQTGGTLTLVNNRVRIEYVKE